MVLPEWAFWAALAVMAVGLLGTLIPVLPDIWLIWLAALAYALAEHFATIDPLSCLLYTSPSPRD